MQSLFSLSPGVLTIRAVQEAMRHQSVEYIFPFSSHTFETDLNFIVLSNGKQSTFFQVIIIARFFHRFIDDHLQTNLNIPMQLNVSNAQAGIYKSPADIKLPSTDKLAQFRQLAGGAKVGNINVGEAVGKVSWFFHQLDLLNHLSSTWKKTS